VVTGPLLRAQRFSSRFIAALLRFARPGVVSTLDVFAPIFLLMRRTLAVYRQRLWFCSTYS